MFDVKVQCISMNHLVDNSQNYGMKEVNGEVVPMNAASYSADHAEAVPWHVHCVSLLAVCTGVEAAGFSDAGNVLVDVSLAGT
jgi:hypothetical protein